MPKLFTVEYATEPFNDNFGVLNRMCYGLSMFLFFLIIQKQIK